MKRQLARLGGFVAVGVLVALTLPAGAAFAASPGAGASGGGGGGGGTPPGPSSTVCPTITVNQGTGGSGTCDGVTVTIPAKGSSNANCGNIIVTVTVNPVGAIAVTNPPAGYSQAYAVTAAFTCSATGAKFTGTLSPAATVVVTNSSIAAGRPIFEFVNGAWSQVTNATVTTGSATFTVPTDPQFVFYVAPIAGGTLAVTGKPVVGEGILAGLLLALGSLGVWGATRRRRAPIGA
jgi:hypothetical protein